MTQLGEYIKMALKNIAANKGRTLLTMLGIIIGISSQGKKTIWYNVKIFGCFS